MIDISKIQALSRRIASEFKPERIILFGSYAYGRPDEDSDVDLLVVMPLEGKGIYKSLEILNRVEPDFAIDLLVRSPEQIQERLALNDFFLRSIVEKGKVLYEAPRH